MKTHYDTLGVPRDATADDIRTAYRLKRGALHPDREGGDPGAMAALNAAHTTLGDPAQRERYDSTLPDIERDALGHVERVLAECLDRAGLDDDPIAQRC